MNSLILLLLGVLVSILQTTLLRPLLPQTFVPDTLLLLVLFASVFSPREKGLLLAFSLGILADLFSGAPEGMNSLFLISLFAMSKAIQARVFLGGTRAVVGLVLLAFLWKALYCILLSLLVGQPFPELADGARLWAGECTASVLFTPLLFPCVSRILGLHGQGFLQRTKPKSG